MSSTRVPHFPPSVRAAESANKTVYAPDTIVAARWVWLGVAALYLSDICWLVVGRALISDGLIDQHPIWATDKIEAAAVQRLIISSAIALVMAALTVVCTISLYRGRRWARIALAGITALTVIGTIAWTSPAMVATIFVCVIGVVLMYLPESNLYLSKRGTGTTVTL
jgi:hypothetical protein